MSLSEEIAKALRDAVTPAERLATLLSEAHADRAKIDLQVKAKRRAMLDPLAAPSDIKAARDQLEDLTLSADRLDAAAAALEAALANAQAREAEQRRTAAHDAAKAERDALAKELAKQYPALAGKIAELFGRIALNNAALAKVNADKPAGAEWLAPAETVAFDHQPQNEATALLKMVRLPVIDVSERAMGVRFWPPATP